MNRVIKWFIKSGKIYSLYYFKDDKCFKVINPLAPGFLEDYKIENIDNHEYLTVNSAFGIIHRSKIIGNIIV